MQILKPTKKNITTAVNILNNGGVVVCPTDTVYGFLALAENKKAVNKIFKIKKRLKSQTLPIFVRDLKMAKELAEIDEPASAKGFGEARQEKILKSKWPGKYTFVLKLKNKKERQEQVSTSLAGGHRIFPMVISGGTVALRVPKYKFLNDLLGKINKPLAQTSVNISNNPAMTKSREIIKQFGKSNYIDLIIDAGDLKRSKLSKIIDLTQEKILRIR